MCFTQYMCSNGCGDNYVKATADALGHSYVDVNITEPTCTNDGLKRQTCSVCKTNNDQPITKLSHIYGEWKTVSEPTCTEDGASVISCVNEGCSEKRITPIYAVGHTIAVTKATLPTCTEGGYTTYTCTICSYETKGDEKAKLGHDYK